MCRRQGRKEHTYLLVSVKQVLLVVWVAERNLERMSNRSLLRIFRDGLYTGWEEQSLERLRLVLFTFEQLEIFGAEFKVATFPVSDS